jgi:biopolymer transport protein ExbD
MTSRRWRRHRRHEVPELNITAFMNLMVALVPFLLITAVFSKLTILDLDLPGPGSASGEPPRPDLALEITVRAKAIEVGDRNAGLLKRFDSGAAGYDYEALGSYLAEVKQQFPDKRDATVLLEPNIAYDVLVAVMDKVRVDARVDPSTRRRTETALFPDISIGDAPLRN